MPRDFVWLLPTIRVLASESFVDLSDEQHAIRLKAAPERVLPLLNALDGTRSAEELFAYHGDAPALLPILERERWLVTLSRRMDAIVAATPTRTRQLSYFAHVQRHHPDVAFDELETKRVLIVGMGGVGSYTASMLAGAGVRRFVLCDFDTVDASNLNRQFLFSTDDIGRPKVEIAARELLRRYPDLELETTTRNFDVAPDERLPACDAILVCGETTSIWDRPELVGTTPLLMAGYFGGHAVVGPCVAPEHGTLCWPCVLRTRRDLSCGERERRTLRRPNAWNSSGSAINGVAGSMLAEAVVRLLAPSLGGPLLLGERMRIDLATFAVSRKAISAEGLERRAGERCFCRNAPLAQAG